MKTSSIKWFKSYLSKRNQIVMINGVASEEMEIICGVPQGSVLGPIFFILYINSISNLKIDGKIITYADDTCLLFSGPTWNSVYQKSEKELTKVINHLSSKKLLLNIKKTVFMTFTINKEKVPFDKITVHPCRNKEQYNDNICKSISKVPFTRYLGITYDENLRWNVHIDNIVMRLRISVYEFCKLKDIFPINIVRNIYLSLYQAVFQYGNRVWGGLTQKAIKPLQL